MNADGFPVYSHMLVISGVRNRQRYLEMCGHKRGVCVDVAYAAIYLNSNGVSFFHLKNGLKYELSCLLSHSSTVHLSDSIATVSPDGRLNYNHSLAS